LQRVISNPEQLAHWCRQIPPVKTIAEEMLELEAIYRNVLSVKQRAQLQEQDQRHG
jgi:hypothetical protein